VTALAERQPVTAGDLARLWQELAAASGLPAALVDASSPSSSSRPDNTPIRSVAELTRDREDHHTALG
jgi:hypothetical protein